MFELSAEAQHSVLAMGTADILPAGSLSDKLHDAVASQRQLRVKWGIDASGPELTIGHAVVLRKLRQFQDFGHKVVLIIGDFTGRIGDPTDRTATRPELSAEQTAEHSADYLSQVLMILDNAEEHLEVRRNTDWLESLPLADFIKATGSLTLARLLERDDFELRFSGGTPIAMSEMIYPFLQGYDSVAVTADVEVGATDQTFNNLVGRAVQKRFGMSQQCVMTLPLLVGVDGVKKMGKSAGNWVGVREPASEQFGKLMSMPDSCMVHYAETLCVFDVGELEVFRGLVQSEPATAKRDLAERIVAVFHSDNEGAAARETFDSVFKRGEIPSEVEATHELPDSPVVHVPALLVDVGFASSRSEGRRLLKGGGIRVEGEKLSASDLDMPREKLAGRILQRGNRRAVSLTDAT